MIYQIEFINFCAISENRIMHIANGCNFDYLKRSRSNPWFKDSTNLISTMKFLGEIHTEDIPILGQSNWVPQLYSMWNFHTREPEDKSWQRLVFPDLSKYWKELTDHSLQKNLDQIILMGPTPESSTVITGIDWGKKSITVKNKEGEMTKGERDCIQNRVDEIPRMLKSILASNEQSEKDNYRLSNEIGKLKIEINSLNGAADYWKQKYENDRAIITHVCKCEKTPEDPFAANRQNNPFWVDREGVKQHIQSLDDKHLINIFNVLNNEARYGENPPKMRYILNEFKRRGISVQRG